MNKHQTNSQQLLLLDCSGTPPFVFNTDATPVPGSANIFDIADMRVKLNPQPNNCENALLKVMAALTELHRLIPGFWLGYGPKRPIAIGLVDVKATARFWLKANAGIISCTYKNGHLDILLPQMKLWAAHGLGWLGTYQPCCDRSKKNPTPWLGKPCDCDVTQSHYVSGPPGNQTTAKKSATANVTNHRQLHGYLQP